MRRERGGQEGRSAGSEEGIMRIRRGQKDGFQEAVNEGKEGGSERRIMGGKEWQ